MRSPSVDSIVNAGVENFNRRLYEASIPKFSEALRRCPEPGIYLFRSMAYLMMGHGAQALRDVREAKRLEPGSSAVRLGSAEILRDCGEHSAALKECQAAARLDPASVRALKLKVDLESRLGLKAESLRSLSLLARLEPREIHWRLQSARLLIDMGKPAAALTECAAAARLDPRCAEALRLKFDLELRLGLKERGLVSLRNLARLEPNQARWRLQSASLLADMGKLAAALRECGAAAGLDPSSSRAFELKSEIESRLGSNADSLRSVEKAIELQPRSFPLRMRAARILKDTGNLKSALRQCRAAVRLDGKSAQAFSLKSVIEARLGLKSQALASSLKAVRLEPHRLQWRLEAAALLRSSGQFVAALKQYEAAYRALRRCGGQTARPAPRRGLDAARHDWDELSGPGDRGLRSPGAGVPWLYFNRGVLRRPSGRQDWGEFFRTGARADSPTLDCAGVLDWEIEALIGEAYALAGETKKGLKRLSRCQAAAPAGQRGDALAWEGKIHLRLGNYREALRILDKAVALGCSHAFCWRGSVKIKLGRVNEALPDLERAVDLAPWDVEARIWRQEARRLKDDYLSWSVEGFRPSIGDCPEESGGHP